MGGSSYIRQLLAASSPLTVHVRAHTRTKHTHTHTHTHTEHTCAHKKKCSGILSHLYLHCCRCSWAGHLLWFLKPIVRISNTDGLVRIRHEGFSKFKNCDNQLRNSQNLW